MATYLFPRFTMFHTKSQYIRKPLTPYSYHMFLISLMLDLSADNVQRILHRGRRLGIEKLASPGFPGVKSGRNYSCVLIFYAYAKQLLTKRVCTREYPFFSERGTTTLIYWQELVYLSPPHDL